MIKFVLKIFNLNGISLEIRFKQKTSGASTKQCGTSFELSEFQSDTIKKTCNMRMHEPQIRIANHESSLTSELESEICHEDLPMRQRTVKPSVLCLGFSSFSKLEESSLEKSRLLRAAHAQDIIF
jgi:hypothetical protein